MQWTIVISDIQARHGWTQPQIAKAAGCGQATISDLATGKTTEPRFGLGKVLLALRDKRPIERPSPATIRTAASHDGEAAQVRLAEA